MKKWYIWLGVVLVGAFIYMTRGVLLPFLSGLAIAYFLDPITDKLEERKVPRGAASALVIVLFFTLLVGVMLAFWPILQSQVAVAAKSLPETMARLRPWLDELLKNLDANYGIGNGGDASSLLAGVADQAMGKLNQAVGSAVQGGLAVFNILTLILISPVVAFYLLRDWDNIVARIGSWLPVHIAPTVRTQAAEVDKVLAGFVRGQMIVSLTMGILYAAGWSLVGLDLAIVLGMLAAVLAFIPFVGALFVAVVAVALAIGQFGFDGTQIGLVMLVFLVVQVIEGAFLTPRLIGERVGLHPVWVLFAVFAGGEVMGLVGVLIAVPTAAALAVLVRFVINKYLTHYDLHPAEPVVAIGQKDDKSDEKSDEEETKSDD